MYAAYTQAVPLRNIAFRGMDVWPINVATCGDLALVTDAQHQRVVAVRIDNGSFVRFVANADGSQGEGDGQLDRPCGVAVYGDLALVADSANRRVSLFRVNDGAFVRHLYDERPWNPDSLRPLSIAVHGDLALVGDEHKATSVFRIADGVLIRTIGGGDKRKYSSVAVYGDLALVATSPPLDVAQSWNVEDALEWRKLRSQWNASIFVFRIADGAAVREIRVDGPADHMAVSGDLVLVNSWQSARVAAYRIADGTCAYHFDGGGGKYSIFYGMAVCGDDDATLLVTEMHTCSVRLFRLPKAIRWQPDVDVHAQFGAAFRGVVVAVLAVASKPPRSSLSRLPLELACSVLGELTRVQ